MKMRFFSLLDLSIWIQQAKRERERETSPQDVTEW